MFSVWASIPNFSASLTLFWLLSTTTTCLPLSIKYCAISRDTFEAPIINIPSDLVKNTPETLANKRAVVAFNNTVPNTIINTKGVMYSAPTTSSALNLLPKSEAIPAATIPRGPTQLINIFSLALSFDPYALTNTAKGLITNTTVKNRAKVSHR